MKRKQSIGEMISTLCFFGLSVYLLVFSLELLETGQTLRAFGGFVASVFCGLGSLRFVIADIVTKWRGY